MLEVAQHMERCSACREEYHVIQEVKVLLRAVSRPQPTSALEYEIRKRIATEEAISQINLCLSFSVRPQRAKRLATAMALSCISVLAVAAPFGAGTLALTYSRQPDKHMPFTVALTRRAPTPLLSVSDPASGDIFASPTVPIMHLDRGIEARRDYGQEGYGLMVSQNPGYASFAEQQFSSFGDPRAYSRNRR